ncbi:MAG: hypothetical protein ACM3ML_05520 [Micromonosporaceae bacterium]
MGARAAERRNRLIARGATVSVHDPAAVPAIALGKVATRKVLIDARSTS